MILLQSWGQIHGQPSRKLLPTEIVMSENKQNCGGISQRARPHWRREPYWDIVKHTNSEWKGNKKGHGNSHKGVRSGMEWEWSWNTITFLSFSNKG